MAYGLYISAEGAKAQSRNLEVIANNLANIDTVGFKPDSASFQARYAEAIQQGEATAGSGSMNDVGGGVKVIDVITNYSAGRLQTTGNQTDMAIIGEGFFQVQGNNGETLLTRAGNLTIDNLNRLVTEFGSMPVLDAAGGEITIAPGEMWELTRDGMISQAGSRTPLGIVKPIDLNTLVKVGQNMFKPGSDLEPVPENAREVRQGVLEMSGANSMQQMVAMIQTTRAFEANTKMIQNQDSMSGSLISRVLHA